MANGGVARRNPYGNSPTLLPLAIRRDSQAGHAEVIHHVTWFLGAVEDFSLHRTSAYIAFADPQAAVAQVKAEGLNAKPTRRVYRQEYVVFLRAAGKKIGYLR